MPYAIEQETGREVSVRSRLTESYHYVCPFCRKEVILKKGDIRQHHFSHLKDDYPCSANQESILHERAKNFIHNALKKKETFNITIKQLTLLSKQERLILELLGITCINIKSDQIPATQYKNHEVEKTINQYDLKNDDNYIKRPDIYSENNGNEFAWEVFVTHAVDEEKKLYYKNKNIPYIEIKPTAIDKNYSNFEFELINYEGFCFTHLNESFYDNLITHHSTEIFEIYRKNIEEQVFNQLKEKAYSEGYKDFQKEMLNLKKEIIDDYRIKIRRKLEEEKDIENIMKESLCTIVESEDPFCLGEKYPGKWFEFKEAKINPNGKNKPYIGIYDKDNHFYRINSKSYPERLLNMFIETFYNNNRLMALLDKSNKIIGFEIDNSHTPKLRWFDSKYEVNKTIEMEEIRLQTIFEDGNNGYSMGNRWHKIFFKSELVLKKILVELLNQLNRYYKCWIKPLREPDKKTPYVAQYLFKITDRDYLINTIMNIIDV